MSDQPLLAGCQSLSMDRGAYGALVLHGFTSCPQSVRPLADGLAGAGFAVEAPLLPGHGTVVEDMIPTTWDDWSRGVEAAYRDLTDRCHRVVVAGLSMGGTLAIWLAVRHPEVAGVVAVNPLVDLGADMTDLANQMLARGEDRIPAVAGDIADPNAHEVAYDAAPLAPLLSLATAAAELGDELEGLTCPLLLMTSLEDHVVPPGNSDVLAAAVQGPVERVSLNRSHHVATLDYDRHLVRAEAVAFARRVCTGPDRVTDSR